MEARIHTSLIINLLILLKFNVQSVTAMLVSGSSTDVPSPEESAAILKNVNSRDLEFLAKGINDKPLFDFKKALLQKLFVYTFDGAINGKDRIKEYDAKITLLNAISKKGSTIFSQQYWEIAIGKEMGVFKGLVELDKEALIDLGKKYNNEHLWKAIVGTEKLKGENNLLLSICGVYNHAIDYLDTSRLKTMTKEELFFEAAQISQAKISQAYNWKNILPELEKYKKDITKDEYYEMLKWSNHTIDLTADHWSVKRLREYSLDELAELFSFLESTDSRLKIIAKVMLEKK